MGDKALHRRAADATCYYTKGDYCKQASGESCTTFKDSYKSGACSAQGFKSDCKLRYDMHLWYKTDADCKKAQDKALHRRAAATCYYTKDNYCKQASGDSCETFKDSYTSGACSDKGFKSDCKLRYDMHLWYKTDKDCKTAQDKALHRRAARK